MPKLTKRVVDALEANDKPYSVYCGELKGLGVRVMPSGVKTWILDYRPLPGGRGVPKRRLTLGRANVVTADQARDMARANLELVRKGGDPAREQADARTIPTFRAFAETYLSDHVKVKLKESTQVSYASILRAHLIPAFGPEQLSTITRKQVVELHARISKDHPTTANRVVEVMRAVYKYAHHIHALPTSINPTDGVKANPEKARKRYLTDVELGRLFHTLRVAEQLGLPWIVDPQREAAKHLPKGWRSERVKYDPFTLAAFVLLLFTGCRLREILRLKWSDIDPHTCKLSIRNAKTGDRDVMMSDLVVEVIAQLAARYNRAEHGVYVIPGRDIGTDKEKPRADLNRPWRHIRAHAELGDFHIHDLRHSHASFALKTEGADLLKVGKLLGHASIQSTQRYAHLMEQEHRRVAEATGDVIQQILHEHEVNWTKGQPPRRPQTMLEILGVKE